MNSTSLEKTQRPVSVSATLEIEYAMQANMPGDSKMFILIFQCLFGVFKWPFCLIMNRQGAKKWMLGMLGHIYYS